MENQKAFIENLVQQLAATPVMLTAWLSGLNESQLAAKENADAWDNRTILKHLIFGEQTDWIPRLNIMIAGKGEALNLEAFDMKGHEAIETDDIALLLSQFQEERVKGLLELQALAAKQDLLALKAIHPGLGLVNGKQMLAAWPVHDLTHIYQISRNLATAYKPEVGPWQQFLRIIRK